LTPQIAITTVAAAPMMRRATLRSLEEK
jgi:hypothetical protein